MTGQLTSGAIQQILNGEVVPNAVVQLLGCRKVAGGGVERYRVLISDGEVVCQSAILSTQLNHLVLDNQFEKFTIVKINNYTCNTIYPEKKIIVLLEVVVLVPGHVIGFKIGDPVCSRSSISAIPVNNISINQTEQHSENEMNGNSDISISSSAEAGQNDLENFATEHRTSCVWDIHPICSLSPYQNKWTIRARVTGKTSIRTWSNARGEGYLFSVIFSDESGEIKATAFCEDVDRLYDFLNVNQVYYVSKAILKPAYKNINSIKNEYEMTLSRNTIICLCTENISSIPKMHYNFMPISQIHNSEKDSIIDVIGVCKHPGDLHVVTVRRTGVEIEKRDLKIVDTSNVEINLTLWGEEARNFDGAGNPVIAVKGTLVSDYNGRSLSVTSSSTLQINPDIEEAHVLKTWFERVDCRNESCILNLSAGSRSISASWKTFAQAREENLGMIDRMEVFTNKATVVLINQGNCMYMACPTNNCNKKVQDLNNGLYRCEKCQWEYSEFEWRLLLSFDIADFSEHITACTCFQEAAEVVLGFSAGHLIALKENDAEKFEEILQETNFKSFVFKLCVKMEVFNEERRLKHTILSVDPLNSLEYGKKLLSKINELEKLL